MASLIDLKGEFTNSDLEDKIQAALIIAVQNILDGTPTSDQQKYAAHVFANPSTEAKKAQMSVLAKNSSATVAQIDAASDASIQSNVDEVVETLSVAYNASIV